MKPVVDPWADPNDPFTQTIDFGMTRDDEVDPDEQIFDQHPGLTPEVVTVPVVVPPVPGPVVVSEPIESEVPEVVEFEEGTATLEKERGQWKLTLVNNVGGNPQVFWGKNKNELVLSSLAKAQLNATKKIRELNLKVKLGANSAPKTAPAPVIPSPNARQLTADELFEIKTQLESNPGEGFENLIQKKYGVSFDEIVRLAQRGANADANLQVEAVANDFVRRNPDYYGDNQGKNFESIVRWLGKFKASNPNATVYELNASGNWTVENIEEAFKDLADDNLLVSPPKAPKQAPQHAEPPTPVAVQNEPAPAPRPDERIVRTETRPRAALGIRTSDVTPVAAPEVQTAPSVEDLENLSDADVRATLAAIRKQRQLNRR